MTIASFIQSTSQTLLANAISNLVVSVVSIPLVYILVNEVIRKYSRIPAFGGPSGLPLIGNIWDIRVNASEKYRQWAVKYGDVYQIMLGNIPIVVVNSTSAAKAIFGQNLQALSSRPEFYTFHKVSPSQAPIYHYEEYH